MLFSQAVLHTCDVIFQVSLPRSPYLGAEEYGVGENGRERGCRAMQLGGWGVAGRLARMAAQKVCGEREGPGQRERTKGVM